MEEEACRDDDAAAAGDDAWPSAVRGYATRAAREPVPDPAAAHGGHLSAGRQKEAAA